MMMMKTEFVNHWQDAIENDSAEKTKWLMTQEVANFTEDEGVELILSATRKAAKNVLEILIECELPMVVTALGVALKQQEEIVIKNVLEIARNNCFKVLQLVMEQPNFKLANFLLQDASVLKEIEQNGAELLFDPLFSLEQRLFLHKNQSIRASIQPLLSDSRKLIELALFLRCELNKIGRGNDGSDYEYWAALKQSLKEVRVDFKNYRTEIEARIVNAKCEGAISFNNKLENLRFSFIRQWDDLNREKGEPKQFSSFLARIEMAKKMKINPVLGALVSQEQLMSMFAFLLNNKLHVISALKPGEACRLWKHETKLPRTLNIVRASDGEFKLILETKSKLATDNKQRLLVKKGKIKSGKPSWRIDGEPVEYFNLVIKLQSKRDLLKVLRESNISALFSSKYISHLDLGTLHLSKLGDLQISVYSPKMTCDLADLIELELDGSQHDEIIMQLLLAIRDFHVRGVHQDLKPENILLSFTDEGACQLKLADFDLSAMHDSDDRVAGSPFYFSPQVSRVFASRGSATYDFSLRLSLPEEESDIPECTNDLWSLGIIIFLLRHGRLPEYDTDDFCIINSDPLLSGLLEPSKAKRMTIEQAIKIHKTQSQAKNKPMLFPGFLQHVKKLQEAEASVELPKQKGKALSR